MTLVSEVIYNIKNLKEGGLHSDDVELSDDQYLFIANYYRAKLIRQQFAKNKFALAGTEQPLNKVKLEKPLVPVIERALVTEVIPKAIQLDGGMAFNMVGHRTEPFQYIHPGRAAYIQYNRYTEQGNYYYNLDDRLVIIGDPDITNKIKTIPIVGTFENPVKVHEFNLGTALNNYDVDYFLPSSLLDTMLKMIVESELKFSMIIPDDNTNDTQDDQ